ncbi:MAG: ABC transporter permease [Candidatus Bipolaricaulia bacterium]
MMSKLWLVAQYEYARNVFRKSFIFVILSVPLFIAFVIGFGYLMDTLNDEDRASNAAIGYVDHAGLLANPISAPMSDSSEKRVPLIPFQTEEAAHRALESERIQAYYILTPDYSETRQVKLIYIKEPDRTATRQFRDFMQINLLASQPAEIAQRAVADSDIIVRPPDGSREFSGGGPSLNQVLPAIIAFVFVLLTIFSSGYMMDAVTQEKANRTMEVLVTSISPNQLMGGKVLGIVAISFTQLTAWIAFAVLAIVIGGDALGVQWLQNPSLDPKTLLIMIAMFVPAYVIVAALMTTVGVTIVEAQEGQLIIGFYAVLLFMIPMLLPRIAESPNGALSIGLTLFPLTALPAVGMRTIFMTVPVWQIAASVVIQILCALGALWLAGRAFRLGMLRYGQRLIWRELFGRGTSPALAQSLSGGHHE